MANFTQSIREILQQNKLPNESLTNVSNVYDIAVRTLFDDAPMSVISDDYRQQFITGFALHFMNDEIGYETLPLWKIALNEKIYNSGSYINKIFANLDKEIFADYHVKNVVDTGSTTGLKNLDGTVSNDRDIAVSEASNETTTFNETMTDDRDDTRTIDRTNSLERKGSEYRTRGGHDDLEKKGAEVQVNSGTDTTTDSGVQDNINSNKSANYTNAIQINSDTPMGSLQNLRTPGGAVAATTDTSVHYDEGEDMTEYQEGGSRGFNYEEGQTYNYMSGAAESGQTVQNVENGNDKSISSNTSETQHGLNVATKYGTDGTTADRRIDSTEYNSNESTTYGYKLDSNGTPVADKREDFTDEDVTDTLESDITRTKTGSDTVAKTASTTTDDVSTQTTNNEESTSGSHENNIDQIDHSLNWEMLYRSMPLLNKVWEIFDDLFMIIF